MRLSVLALLLVGPALAYLRDRPDSADEALDLDADQASLHGPCEESLPPLSSHAVFVMSLGEASHFLRGAAEETESDSAAATSEQENEPDSLEGFLRLFSAIFFETLDEPA